MKPARLRPRERPPQPAKRSMQVGLSDIPEHMSIKVAKSQVFLSFLLRVSGTPKIKGILYNKMKVAENMVFEPIIHLGKDD